MFCSLKSTLTAVLSLALVALVALSIPTTAMAKGKGHKSPKGHKKPTGHSHGGHHHDHFDHHAHFDHFHGGFGLGIGVGSYVAGGTVVNPVVGTGGYVVNDPVVNPVVSPIVNPVLNPAANQVVYTLFYKDSQGNTQVYGQFVATTYASGTTDWGGLVEARDKLTAAGMECWVRAGNVATASVPETADPTVSNG